MVPASDQLCQGPLELHGIMGTEIKKRNAEEKRSERKAGS